MTTLTNERLGELHGYLKVCGSLVGMGSAWDELADALCELAALRASQPSEETKAYIIALLRLRREWLLPWKDAKLAPEIAALHCFNSLTELENKGWK